MIGGFDHFSKLHSLAIKIGTVLGLVEVKSFTIVGLSLRSNLTYKTVWCTEQSEKLS